MNFYLRVHWLSELFGASVPGGNFKLGTSEEKKNWSKATGVQKNNDEQTLWLSTMFFTMVGWVAAHYLYIYIYTYRIYLFVQCFCFKQGKLLKQATRWVPCCLQFELHLLQYVMKRERSRTGKSTDRRCKKITQFF